jgi:3alpha(or 20beta)-hydroxysteroid dehydrogenase
VRLEDDWDRAVSEAASRFGSLDVLVNNAGITMGTMSHDTTLEEYMRVIEVNQIGVFLGMRAAIPAMLQNRRGSIVNLSSTNGLQGAGGTIAYTASKFAVRGMTKNAALEYGKAGIRVNSIPGPWHFSHLDNQTKPGAGGVTLYTPTPLLPPQLPAGLFPAGFKSLRRRIPGPGYRGATVGRSEGIR